LGLISQDKYTILVKKGTPLLQQTGSFEKRPGPYHKKARQTLMAPADGLLFTLREYPMVYPGSLLARILTGGFQK
jgi:hypothetical protein